MLRTRVTKLLPVLCLVAMTLVDQSVSRKHRSRNYLLTRVQDDGEVETIVRYRGVTARELTAGTVDNMTSSGDGQHPSQGFTLWQVRLLIFITTFIHSFTLLQLQIKVIQPVYIYIFLIFKKKPNHSTTVHSSLRLI